MQKVRGSSPRRSTIPSLALDGQPLALVAYDEGLMARSAIRHRRSNGDLDLMRVAGA